MPPTRELVCPHDRGQCRAVLGTLLVVSRAIGNEFGRSLRNRSSGCLDWSGDPPRSSRIPCSFAVIPSASEGPHLSRCATQNSLDGGPCSRGLSPSSWFG